MRLLCDEMLRRLGRSLRAAGHDTGVSEGGEPDRVLIDRARTEDRLLVTRDRRLAAEARTADIPVVLLTDDRTGDQALALGREAGVDWLAAPFTRCVVDNTPLVDAAPEDLPIPEAARRLPGPHRLCPACGRAYWPGSHVRRMMEKLTAWQAALPDSA
jgi:uncharacterized protein with PIN domain